MGSAKGGGQTIGYKYYMSLLMGIGRTISEIVEIKVGGKTAWTGPACRNDGDVISIESADLFGGDEKEGGIFGPAKVFWGHRTQVLSGGEVVASGTVPDPRETISAENPDAKLSELRGITSIWFDGEICSLNPYPKEWKFRCRRHIHGWYNDDPWYPEKSIVYLSGPEIITYKKAVRLGILADFTAKGGSKKNAIIDTIKGNIKALNGAHIIFECATNPEWGRGNPRELLDENSFVYAANRLCLEGVGLCFFWTRQEDVDVFIQTVLDHIGGVLYTDRSTGLLTLRLIRDDYNLDDLPTFDFDSGLLDILLDDSGSQDIAYNEVVVKYHDPISDTDGEARAQNVGARIAQGSSNSLSKEYPGFPTKDLAGRAAVRDLIVQSAGLKRFKVKLDRSAWRIAPGMPFRVVAPQRRIASIVLRAGEIVDSTIQNGGYIEVSAIEDVFSMPQTSMVVAEMPTWKPPLTDPVPPDDTVLFEMSYYDLTKHLNQFEVTEINNEDTYFALIAAQPVRSQLNYDLMYEDAEHQDSYVSAGTFSFTANAILANPIDYLDENLQITKPFHIPDDLIGDSMLIDEERFRVNSYDVLSGLMNVERGVADTLPQKHAAGARVWFPDDDLSSNRTVYSEGEVIHAAAATRTTSAVLPYEELDTRFITLQGRIGRPYPVGDLRVDGVSVFTAAGDHPEPVLTWVSRNRLLQQDQLIGHTDGPVAEEAGTSYEVVVKNLTDFVLSTHAVAGGTFTFTYTTAMRAADGDPEIVHFDVVTIRDGMRSLYSYNVPVTIEGGWDYAWGYNWGS